MNVIILESNVLGKGDDKLGNTLMGSFLRKLWGNATRPDHIVLYNSGVLLATEGSEHLHEMEALQEAGVDILACSTCLNFFEKELKVGRVSGMEEIVSLMMEGKVVTL